MSEYKVSGEGVVSVHFEDLTILHKLTREAVSVVFVKDRNGGRLIVP